MLINGLEPFFFYLQDKKNWNEKGNCIEIGKYLFKAINCGKIVKPL